jgi:hypothetical protein
MNRDDNRHRISHNRQVFLVVKFGLGFAQVEFQEFLRGNFFVEFRDWQFPLEAIHTYEWGNTISASGMFCHYLEGSLCFEAYNG